MSDYWVSHKKYFCKYCEIYIADDAPSKRQHENGLRHKGNRDRYVRNLYKEGERRKKDLDEEKREMERIEKAAGVAYARDISSGHTSAASSSKLSQPAAPAPSSASTSKKPEKPSSPWANYSTAQSLGITDPDEEYRLAELERRKTQGLVGEWQVVAPPPPPLPGQEPYVKDEDSKEGVLSGALPRNREAEASAEDEEDGRQFKLRKRKLNAGLDDIWDPGDVPIKLKVKLKHESAAATATADPPGAGAVSTGSIDGTVRASAPAGTSGGFPDAGGEKPKWKPMGWKRATEPEDNLLEVNTEDDDRNMKRTLSAVVEDRPIKDGNDVTVAMEPPDQSLAPPPDNDRCKIKEEDPSSGISEPSSGLFRKRKIPIGSRGKR